MSDKMIAVPRELLEELRECAELCADDVRAHDLGEDSAEAHFRQVGRACDALLREAPHPAEQKPPLQLPDFATDPDDSDEVASLWDHGFKRGWNACLETVAKAMQPAEQQPSPDVSALVEALEDMLSGWRYIRESHGDLYGVGWDRAENKARAALSAYRKQEDKT